MHVMGASLECVKTPGAANMRATRTARDSLIVMRVKIPFARGYVDCIRTREIASRLIPIEEAYEKWIEA